MQILNTEGFLFLINNHQVKRQGRSDLKKACIMFCIYPFKWHNCNLLFALSWLKIKNQQKSTWIKYQGFSFFPTSLTGLVLSLKGLEILTPSVCPLCVQAPQSSLGWWREEEKSIYSDKPERCTWSFPAWQAGWSNPDAGQHLSEIGSRQLPGGDSPTLCNSSYFLHSVK